MGEFNMKFGNTVQFAFSYLYTGKILEVTTELSNQSANANQLQNKIKTIPMYCLLKRNAHLFPAPG